MPRETDRLLETPSNNTMSMNVGDSSDLIHGGGGGLSVFWRSRTNFERKLLVVVVVLAIAVLALIITVAVLAANTQHCSSRFKANVTNLAARNTTRYQYVPGYDSKGGDVVLW